MLCGVYLLGVFAIVYVSSAYRVFLNFIVCVLCCFVCTESVCCVLCGGIMCVYLRYVSYVSRVS